MRGPNAYKKAEREAGLDVPIWNIKFERSCQKTNRMSCGLDKLQKGMFI